MKTQSQQRTKYRQPKLDFIQMHKTILCNSGIDGDASTASFEEGYDYEDKMI